MRTVPTRRTRGFTLVELLVVIAIIAILAAILFPVFARAREKAKTATCQSNLKQLAMAIRMYCDDADDSGPFTECGSFWQAKVSAAGYAAKLIADPATGAWSPLYSCPGGGAYGMNYYRGSHGPAGTCGNYAPWRFGEAKTPEQTLLIGDSIGVLACRPSAFYDPNGNGTGRHNALSNIAFCDGHVKGMDLNWLQAPEGDTPWYWWGL